MNTREQIQPAPRVQASKAALFAQWMHDAGIDEIKTLDTDLRVVTWNHMCEAVNGIPREAAAGKHLLEIYPQATEWPAVMEALDQALLGRRSFVPYDQAGYCNGHSEHHFVPLKDEAGTVQGIMIIIHDVAHRLAAENKLAALNRELREKLRELQRVNAELATFTHVTSHDLKEPLRKIYTFVEMTVTEEQGRISDKGRSNLRRVQSSVQRLGLLTDDLVSFAEASAPEDATECVALTEVFTEALAGMEKLVREHGALVTIKELPAVRAPRRLAALLARHLLSNALKFHDGTRTPQVSVRTEDMPLPGDKDEALLTPFVCIAATDNGIGIEAEYHEKIFAIFQRLHDRGTYPGTGIGLAICRKIVERAGGAITVESTPGAGSTFRCWLPAT